MHACGRTHTWGAVPFREDSRESSCLSASQYNGIVLSQEKQRNAISTVGRQYGTGANVVVFSWLEILGKCVPLKMFYIHVSSGASKEIPGNTSAVFSIIATALCAFVYFTVTRNGETIYGVIILWLMISISVTKNMLSYLSYRSCSIILISWHFSHT